MINDELQLKPVHIVDFLNGWIHGVTGICSQSIFHPMKNIWHERLIVSINISMIFTALKHKYTSALKENPARFICSNFKRNLFTKDVRRKYL